MKLYSFLLIFLAGTITAQAQKTLNKRKLSSITSKTDPTSKTVQGASKTANVSQVNQVTPVVSKSQAYEVMKLKLPLTSVERDYYVKKVGGLYILNGDIIVGSIGQKLLSYRITNTDYRWPNASLPVIIDASIYMNGKGDELHEAIRFFNEKTKLCIVPRTTERDYIRVSFSTDRSFAGSSAVGKQGGEQVLLLTPTADTATVLHEMMHAAGFYHEQGREDRDKFIHIFLDNVDPENRFNFQTEGGTTHGGYDFCSIMHYDTKAFAKNPTLATIICINPENCPTCIGRSKELTGQDLLGIDQFYANVTRPACRTIIPNPNIPAQFPTVYFTESEKAMQSFRHRADYAAANGFAGGFPNFHEAQYGPNLVGGTILIHHGKIVWMDVPGFVLDYHPKQNFAERMRACQDYAVANGFIGGYPTYHVGDAAGTLVLGNMFLTNEFAEFREVPLSELGTPVLNDIGARFRSANDYAFRNGFLGGFPTFYDVTKEGRIVCGTILIRKEAGEWRDVILAQMPR
jgi:hypothetical protein